MNATEIKNILATSEQNAWIVDDESGTFAYKDDVNLQIIRTPFEYQTEFNEPWATRHPNPTAYRVDYVVKYRDAVVDRKVMISVDGHRAELPMTKSINNLTVTASDVNFARIIATGGNENRLNEYLDRSGITEIINE